MKVGIIGAGIGGIATAIRLATRGYTVEVFEANSFPGGKLSEFELEDFRFDAGPSLFTMPQFIEDLFKLAGRDINNYFQYRKLDEVCHYFWEDGSRVTAHADQEKFAQEVEDTFQVPKERILNALADSSRKYNLTAEVFLYQSLHQAKNFLNLKTLKGVLNIPRLDIFTSMNATNEKRLQHPKLVQLFNRFATYNGSNPYEAPGILTSIPHLEHGIGTFFPEGGMYSIIKALHRLAMDLGVQFHFNQKVSAIIVEDKQAKGLKIGTTQHDYDLVVSNMDVFFTYKKLLPNQPHPTKTLAQPKSSSALIFYWGINQKFQELGLHNILFSDDYKTEFDYIFNKKSVYDDPTVYINISQKHAPQDAPQDCENWFVMVNVPHNEGQDWDAIVEKTRANVIKKVSRMLKVDLKSLIACEHLLDPRTIESRTQSHLGALYGTSSNNRMAAFLRHPNFSNNIKGLYFCGGSVHPGGGIPLSLLSAKIVDDVVQSKYKTPSKKHHQQVTKPNYVNSAIPNS